MAALPIEIGWQRFLAHSPNFLASAARCGLVDATGDAWPADPESRGRAGCVRSSSASAAPSAPIQSSELAARAGVTLDLPARRPPNGFRVQSARKTA